MREANLSADGGVSARTRQKIFDQVRRCLMNLVGGSGHLACFHVVADTFLITKIEQLGDDIKEYHFSAQAYRESEFAVATEGEPEPPAETIRGSIVLDDQFELTRDEEGRIRLRPWRTMEHLR